MRHKCVAKKFGRTSSHRRAMMRNMVTNLVLQGSIKTTLPKAKQIRRDAEKIVTVARKGTLASRRLAAARLLDPEAVRKLINQVVPSMEGREGGYTRIIKLGTRRGDAAELCILQWVEKLPESTDQAAAGVEAAAATVAEGETVTATAEAAPVTE
ncbi:MAG: 50S ribosomal protein L17 [Kiritimatiellae bacterium]|nr:50S ribosomal protein L17 [Kiritimatiellia bacterium]